MATINISEERYAELVIAENSYKKLCAILIDRIYTGFKTDELLMLRDMTIGKPDHTLGESE